MEAEEEEEQVEVVVEGRLEREEEEFERREGVGEFLRDWGKLVEEEEEGM